MAKKRLLIIGAAQQRCIKDYLSKVDFNSTEVHLLVPERDRDAYDLKRVTYFNGTFHPLFPPLLKSILFFRPDEVIIICGITYDHDNVVRAVSFYSFFNKTNIFISVREDISPVDSRFPSPLKEILKWSTLSLIASLIKFLSPFKKVRVGEIYSERLGHMVMDSEIYLSEAEAGQHALSFDLFCFKDNKTANKTLAEVLSRQMRIYSFNRYILEAIRVFNMCEEHEIILNTRTAASGRDVNCALTQSGIHLSFTSDQKAKGIKEYKNLGCDPEKPHVCLLGRDSAYLNSVSPQFNDEDMQRIRNMDIETFIPCANELAERGYNVLRMGSIVAKELEVDHSGFVDYATSGKRSDFMDIYLPATCAFFVGVQSGPMHIPMAFRIPCLSINVAQLEMIPFCSEHDLAIFKLIWSRREKRILTISEIVDSGMARWRVEKYYDPDLELIDNTEDEIMEAAREMHLRVTGDWKMSPDDLNLQKRFHAKFKPSFLNSRFISPISTFFLRKHEKELF